MEISKNTNKCLKEWNAIVEALGRGKQTFLIRSYTTKVKEFLLYPSVRYTNRDDFINSFQKEYQPFVEKNALPKKDGTKIEIKYFASLENILELSPQRIGYLQKYYIWTSDHVKSYLKGKKAQIWLLRIYKLKEPHLDQPIPGMIKFVNLKENVTLEGMEPVLSDSEFTKITDEILNI